MKKCPNCGYELRDSDVFCGVCGTKYIEEDNKALELPEAEEVEDIDSNTKSNIQSFLSITNQINKKEIETAVEEITVANIDNKKKEEKKGKKEKEKEASEKVKKGSGFWKYLLLLLLAAAIGLGVWYYLQKSGFNFGGEDISDTNEEEIIEVEPEDELYVEGREVGAIIQTKEEINKTLEELDNQEYLEKENELKKFSDKYNEFAMDVVKSTIVKGDNYISSPLSLYSALSLLSNAASGDTLEELNNVLGFSNEELNKLMYLYQLSCNSWEGDDIIRFGNSVWLNGDMGFELNDNYRDIVTSYYNSDIYTESFLDKDNTIDKMNDWVEEHTNGAIKDLFDEDNISEATTFVLTNALAFDDRWAFEYSVNNGIERKFNNYDGTVVKTLMMSSTEEKYWEDGKATGIYKSLLNGGYVVLVLPNEDVDIYEYINDMPNDFFTTFEDNCIFRTNETEKTVEEHYTKLTLPKFKYDVTLDLKEALINMGIKDIFSEDANLSKMLNKNYEKLFVDDVIQKATIDLNEEGISATAATMIGGLGAAAPDKEIVFVYHDLILDRPFIYAIVKDGITSFVGVVTNFDGAAMSAEEIAEDNARKGTVTIKVDRLNIRSAPTTSSEKLGKVNKGETFNVLEIKTGEGYTWYKIDENKWIADDGSWVAFKK